MTKGTKITTTTSIAESPPLEPYAAADINHFIAMTTGIVGSILLVAVISTISIGLIALMLCLKRRRSNRPTSSTLKTGEVATAGPSNKMDCTTEMHTTSNRDGLQGKDDSSSPRDNQVEELETTPSVNEAYDIYYHRNKEK